MRRLLHHALAAAGISVLTAGAVTGSLLSGSAQTESAGGVAPLTAAPRAAADNQSSVLNAERDLRLERETRSSRRQAISMAAAASARDKALNAERTRTAARVAALEKKKAAKEKKEKAEAKKRAEEKAKAKRLGYDPDDSPKDIARSMMDNKYGWGASEFSCYNKIIMRESVWDTFADNPTSSAYGIPQALPGSKMASAGSDWRDNPATQIKWGLGYVKSRYGTPCSAWSFKSAHGWY
ncbi:MAG TPA: hypothetical protein VF642_04720 [Propionibacteriaceae bacterium]